MSRNGGQQSACAAFAACIVMIACGSDIALQPGDISSLACANLTECAGLCVDTRFDPSHCGACGASCAPGDACSEGVCASGCPAGFELCGSRCVDTSSDKSHCGACGARCFTGEVCSMGACALECGGGTTECTGRCVDTDVDPDHCGACEVACEGEQVCSEGACACAGSTTPCGASCVNTDNDPAHCGSCNAVCDMGEACANGNCAPALTEVTVTVAAVHRGQWDHGGNHTSINIAYSGRAYYFTYNSYFVFDLSAVTGVVVAAKLRIEVTDYYGPHPLEPISVWDVSTSATDLELGDANVAIYTDLMTGNTYGGFTVLSTDVSQVKELSLNAAALGDIQAALGSAFSLGVHADDILSMNDLELVQWSWNGDLGTQELVITTLQ